MAFFQKGTSLLKKSFAELSSYELKVSLQVTKYLVLLMLQQAGGKKCIAYRERDGQDIFLPLLYTATVSCE
jgi:hypothetical protein